MNLFDNLHPSDKKFMVCSVWSLLAAATLFLLLRSMQVIQEMMLDGIL